MSSAQQRLLGQVQTWRGVKMSYSHKSGLEGDSHAGTPSDLDGHVRGMRCRDVFENPCTESCKNAVLMTVFSLRGFRGTTRTNTAIHPRCPSSQKRARPGHAGNFLEVIIVIMVIVIIRRVIIAIIVIMVIIVIIVIVIILLVIMIGLITKDLRPRCSQAQEL